MGLLRVLLGSITSLLQLICVLPLHLWGQGLLYSIWGLVKGLRNARLALFRVLFSPCLGLIRNLLGLILVLKVRVEVFL